MIGVSNMFIKYIFGCPLKEHIYELEDTATDKDIINLGRYLVTQTGIFNEDAFIHEQVESFEKPVTKISNIKPIIVGLTSNEIESMLAKIV